MDPEIVDIADFPWEEFDDDEVIRPDYENSARIDFNLWSDDAGVLKAVADLTHSWEGRNELNQSCMMVMLLNLYRAYLLDPEKYVVYVRRKGNYKFIEKYNPNRVTWTGLVRVADALRGLDMVDHAKGFFYRGRAVERGKCSRIRASEKLIELLESEYGFSDAVIRRHPREEIIILKDKDKNPATYHDNNWNQAERKRRLLRQYNEFIEKTYIDLHIGDFKVDKLIQEQRVDLSRKLLVRIFNNNKKSLIDGGRFYRGWWQEIPSELRLRIIINNMKVVECDYSGVHIHLLYAREGIDFSRLGKDAYQLPEYLDSKKMRKIFKDLLLVAINAGDPDEAKAAMRRKFIDFPDDYPEVIPDLDEAIEDFREYHQPIAHYFFEGVGHKLMATDADIAEDVLISMMHKGVPVLPIHDSFVCPKIHESLLINSMLTSYKNKCGFDASKAITINRAPSISIKHDELDRGIEYPTETDAEYYYDLTTIKDRDLLARLINFNRDGSIRRFIQLKVLAREEPIKIIHNGMEII